MSESSIESEYGAKQIRVLHVISGLGTGGAENFLLGLARTLSGRVESRVISLGEGGGMLPRFRAAQIDVTELRLKSLSGRICLLWKLIGLVRMIRAWRPDVVQGWMSHGNLGAWALRGLSAPSAELLWSVRQSVDDIRYEKFGTQIAIRLLARFSSRADWIVYNSKRGFLQYLRLGFEGHRALVVPNGFDCERLRPRSEMRETVRQLLGIDRNDMVVAMVARYHPMKDYECYIRAIGLAVQTVPNLRGVCIGTGVTSEHAPIRRLVDQLGLAGSVMLFDERADLDQLYPAIDVVCLTSAWGEGFPNVIGEGMACGVPCVMTDVGDGASIIGDSGYVVLPRDPGSIARAIIELARMGASGRAELGERARARILANYSMPVIAKKYEELYRDRRGAFLANQLKS